MRMKVMLMLVLVVGILSAQMPRKATLGMQKVVDLSVEQAVEMVKEKLKTEGFGVVLEMNVKDIMKNKINKDMKPYVILGACNPPLAYQTILAEKEIGLFLPCNIIIYENDTGKTVVTAVDPQSAMGGIQNPELQEIAAQVKEKLSKVLDLVQ